jgi:hypothetical protein
MKKLIPFAFAIMLGLTPALANNNATADNKTVANTERKLSNAEAKLLVNRLKQIQKMDLKNLSSEQKQQLRTEVQDIKESLKTNVVIYLSAAAIIIIILLILLL